MEFETTAQLEAYELVEDYLTVMGLTYAPHEVEPAFQVPFEDVPAVVVAVFAADDDAAGVLLRSWVLEQPPLTRELCQYLLNVNHRMLLGRFSVDDDGDVAFEHVFAAGDLDKSEFETGLHTITTVAGAAADELSQEFGGRPFG